MIEIEQNYFCARVPSATMALHAWDRQNPFPAQGSEAAKAKYRLARKAYTQDARLASAMSQAILKEAGLPSERRFNHEENAKRYAEEILRDYGVALDVEEQCDIFL